MNITAGRLYGGHLQPLRILLQQLVRHVRHLPLGLGRLGGVLHSQGQHHLALPEGHCVDNGGLYLLHHLGVVVLDKADLGRCLDGDHPCQLQVVDLLLKPLAHGLQVPGRLDVLRKPAVIDDEIVKLCKENA